MSSTRAAVICPMGRATASGAQGQRSGTPRRWRWVTSTRTLSTIYTTPFERGLIVGKLHRTHRLRLPPGRDVDRLVVGVGAGGVLLPQHVDPGPAGHAGAHVHVRDFAVPAAVPAEVLVELQRERLAVERFIIARDELLVLDGRVPGIVAVHHGHRRTTER